MLGTLISLGIFYLALPNTSNRFKKFTPVFREKKLESIFTRKVGLALLIPVSGFLIFHNLLLFISLIILGILVYSRLKSRTKFNNSRQAREDIITFLHEVSLYLRAGQPTLSAIEEANQNTKVPVPETVNTYLTSKKLGVNDGSNSIQSTPLEADWQEVIVLWEYGIQQGISLLAINNYLIEINSIEDAYSGELVAEQAGAVATANILLFLPIIGIIFGQIIGISTIKILVNTQLGNLLLALGLSFALVGSYWSDRIIYIGRG